jgi:hypothetical protein
MNCYDYLACFFAGMFLTNVVPHFVHGISGDCLVLREFPWDIHAEAGVKSSLPQKKRMRIR